MAFGLGSGSGLGNIFDNDVLVLILIVLLFNGGFGDCGFDGLFNEETLAVIIVLWLIAESGFFGKKEIC